MRRRRAAAAQEGAPDLGVKESPARVKATGPGFTVKLRAHGLKVAIDDASFGLPAAGFPVERASQALPPTVRRSRARTAPTASSPTVVPG